MADLISRAAAIAWFFRPYSNEEYYSNLDVKKALEAIPAVDAAPAVHARWILIQNGSGVCSACNRNDHIDSLAAYCRYCGAKMDGERRESE